MRIREGDVVETVDKVLFDVKGFVHPPNRVVAFIRYVPDPKGYRKKDELSYRKVYALVERYALLERAFPQYLVYDPVFDERLCEVPLKDITRHYRPAERLQKLLRLDNLDEAESRALELIRILKETANVSWNELGISGSILVKLHTKDSDVDPVVYGSKSCYKVYFALKSLRENRESPIKPYEPKELKKLFEFRSKDTFMAFGDFVRTESKKVLQGKFAGTDYFIRFLKNWNEVEERYGEVRYKSEGYVKIRARIIDDSEAIFTPCCYRIRDVEILEGIHVEPIREIVSFRGRFCEQARKGEVVVAQGKVERVRRADKPEYYRVLLGNTVSDQMVLT